MQSVYFAFPADWAILCSKNLQVDLTSFEDARDIRAGLKWDCLFVCLFVFYGISIFVGYLMLNPFLYK